METTRIPANATSEKIISYWNQFASAPIASPSTKNKWWNRSTVLDIVSSQNRVVLFLFDATAHRFIYMSEKIKALTGYDASLYTAEDGLNFTISKWHPDYLQACFLMQEAGAKYCIGNEPGKTMVSFDGLYKNSTGKYFRLLQQTLLVEKNKQGQPQYFLSYVQDISHLKKDDTATMVISEAGNALLWKYNFDTKSLEEIKPFSCQEKKILELLSEAKSSKQIADIMKISTHTVDTHRRNLLTKTSCPDTSGLITYSKIVGLL